MCKEYKKGRIMPKFLLMVAKTFRFNLKDYIFPSVL